jgi:hypothetical protein
MSADVELDPKDWEGLSPGYVVRSAEGRRVFRDVAWNESIAAYGNDLLNKLRHEADQAGKLPPRR